MKDNLPCAVVRDLLPIYVEGLTEPETNAAVEAHLKTCPACTARLAAMRAPEPPPEAETAKEVDYLKKVKRRSWKRVVLAVLITVLVLTGALAAKVFIIGSPGLGRRPRAVLRRLDRRRKLVGGGHLSCLRQRLLGLEDGG